MQPGTFSPSVTLLADALQTAGIPYHRLSRRSIENYLTVSQLENWASLPHNATRKRQVRSFRRLTRAQRDHFNMKDGFNQDAKRTDATAGHLYNGISQRDHDALESGFGRNIAVLFAETNIPQGDLEDEESWNELNDIIARLVRLTR